MKDMSNNSMGCGAVLVPPIFCGKSDIISCDFVELAEVVCVSDDGCKIGGGGDVTPTQPLRLFVMV
jgi:hypothetical protein